MSEDCKDRYISYLVDRVNETELDKKAMEFVLEDFLNAQTEMQEELAEMRKTQKQRGSKLDEEVLKRKKAEQKADRLKSQLDFAKKNKFGSKQQRLPDCATGKSVEENPDRTNEKENFDGTKVTPEFLQALAYEVYVKNVTFGLLYQWVTDLGMRGSANTLRNWLKKGKQYLDKLVQLLKDIALEKDFIVNCDETWCKVRKYDKYRKCYIWVLVNKAEQTVIFCVEMAATYHSVISTVKMQGRSAWKFLGKFFTNIFNGCRDYWSLSPKNIGLALCQ